MRIIKFGLINIINGKIDLSGFVFEFESEVELKGRESGITKHIECICDYMRQMAEQDDLAQQSGVSDNPDNPTGFCPEMYKPIIKGDL